jgi:hypothetical protein
LQAGGSDAKSDTPRNDGFGVGRAPARAPSADGAPAAFTSVQEFPAEFEESGEANRKNDDTPVSPRVDFN